MIMISVIQNCLTKKKKIKAVLKNTLRVDKLISPSSYFPKTPIFIFIVYSLLEYCYPIIVNTVFKQNNFIFKGEVLSTLTPPPADYKTTHDNLQNFPLILVQKVTAQHIPPDNPSHPEI